MQLIAAIDEYRGKWNVVEKRKNYYFMKSKLPLIYYQSLFVAKFYKNSIVWQ
jgi:hypothetical protein